nr:hypothetical protein CFP56_38269 [Quercus suber]
MAEELEQLWSKLSFTKEEDDGIELGNSCTKAAKALGKNCVVLKVLTQRSINLDALRKNLRMLWKPNKSLQISEIEDELFMVEFGDTKDKQRVLDMCPWSFEKQLVLLQEFEGELVSKDIVMRRSGWDLNQTGVGPRELNCHSFAAGEPKKPGQHPRGLVEEQGDEVGDVSTPSNAEPSDLTREVYKSEENKEAGTDFHGNGKVSGLVEKLKSKETYLDDREWVLAEVQADKLSEM